MFTEQVGLASVGDGERNIKAPRLSEVDDPDTAGHTHSGPLPLRVGWGYLYSWRQEARHLENVGSEGWEGSAVMGGDSTG